MELGNEDTHFYGQQKYYYNKWLNDIHIIISNCFKIKEQVEAVCQI